MAKKHTVLGFGERRGSIARIGSAMPCSILYLNPRAKHGVFVTVVLGPCLSLRKKSQGWLVPEVRLSSLLLTSYLRQFFLLPDQAFPL